LVGKSANDKQYSMIAVSANVPVYGHSGPIQDRNIVVCFTVVVPKLGTNGSNGLVRD
jgi:hypothetical protein